MGRKRKKKRKARESESLQGELLAAVDEVWDSQVEGEHGPDGAPAEDRSREAVSDDATLGDEATGADSAATPDRVPDRWAKAVGRREAAQRSSARKDANGAVAGEAAVSPVREAAEVARNHTAAVRPAGEPLARAKDLVKQGRIQEAIELYLGILTVNPSNVKAHNNLGVLLDGLKRYEAALEHLEAAAELAPENVEVLTHYASTLTSLARYEEAEGLLRRAQKLDADDLDVRLAIAILYFRRGLYAQAEADLRTVCSGRSDLGPAFYYRGEALNRLGRFDESEQALERAAELLPQDPRPFYTLGHLYDRKHLPDEASEMYRRARRLQRQ